VIGARIMEEIESGGAESAPARVKALLRPIRAALDDMVSGKTKALA
jgi:hypothetical protein